MMLRCCTKHTSPSGTGTSEDPCFVKSTLSPLATLICSHSDMLIYHALTVVCVFIHIPMRLMRWYCSRHRALTAWSLVRWVHSVQFRPLTKAHLDVFANCDHGAYKRIMDLLAAGGAHDQAACCFLHTSM